MKAQIISIAIIAITALIIATFGLLIYQEEKKVKNYFKWPKFKK